MTSIETSLTTPYVVDLTSCDREPIHQINAIQPIGFLLALTADWLVAHVSDNIGGFLDLSTASMTGASIGEIFRAEAIHTIRNRLSILSETDGVERCFGVQLQSDGPLFDLALHRSGDLIIVEAEPSIPVGDLNAGAMVRSMLGRMKGLAGTTGLAGLLSESARLMRALTGFDRVMIYRFHADGSGEVIAERVRGGLEPFLGLHYPRGDIPQQARALLLRNKVRILVDVDAAPSALLPHHDAVTPPLDLSMGTLRAHSVMHVTYLQNMGVGATMTVALVCEGKLWGLISCHHMSARHVGFEQRTTAELFGDILSLQIEKRERADVATYEANTRELRQRLLDPVGKLGAAIPDLGQIAEIVAELVPCDGFGVYTGGDVTLTGDTPTRDECLVLREYIAEHAPDRIFATAELGRVHAPAREFVERAAGMLALPMSRAAGDYLVFFRHELAHAVTWAGRPGKLQVVGPGGPALSPRTSFAAWREIVRGRSAPWTPAELDAAETIRVTLLEIASQNAGLTEAENRAVTHRQEILIAELNHRVRNILGLIRALVAQSRLSARDVDTFAIVLGDRIHALARAHDQITAKNWGPGSLASLVATEVGAFLGNDATRVIFAGPDTLIQPQAFATLALVMHELVTNAAKHGALASGTGQVTIAWDRDPAGNLMLDWQESGGAAVPAAIRSGFGSAIIQRSIPHELGGEAKVDYAPGGLHARFVVPTRFVLPGDALAAVRIGSEKARPPVRLAGTVLLVEDNMIIALEGEDLLVELGAGNVLVAGNVADALRLIESETPTFALLDINLGTEMSWPVASRLRDLGVRYVFATGYGNGIDFPLEHRQVPVIAKPYSKDTIARLLSEA